MIILLFFSILSLTAISQNAEKKITIQNKNISLKEAFEQIELQTDYSIAYEQSNLNLKKRQALSLKSASIEKALTQILKGTGYIYKIKGYHIIISLPTPKTETIGEKTQKLTQTIRGIVVDSKTNAPIEYASVYVLEEPSLNSSTDSLGNFRISNVPIGRYNIQASFTGYHISIISEVSVTSSKEVYVEIPMDENIQYLAEVLVKPEIKKNRTINPMAITGGRMISMEEAGRFANGFDDPARLSAAFAGVAGDIGTNAVAIRGNSPQFTQWRLEGIEIPNPTHFADLSGLGGGFLSALSTQVIGNSDFYNGAFPAEYNNVLSGVFDMHLRNGNNQKYEHAFQVGLMGIDLSSEGPISKKRGSSYLVNYRFSTTSLATGNDLNLKYQDLAFKLNFPTSKAGTFSIWGLGLIDRNKAPIEERSKWETLGDRQAGENRLEKMVGGLAHKYVINENTYIRSSLSATYSKDHTVVDQQADDKLIRVGDIRNSRWDFVFNSYLNTKFSPRHTNRTGVTITNLHYDLDYQVSRYFGLNRPMKQISKGDGESTVFSAYSSSVINLNNNWDTSLGVTAQYFTLNNNLSIEPRVALKWKINPKHSLALAYGLHSRREKLDYYFVEKVVIQSPNQKIPDRKTKCVIKTHINIKQNVIFGAKLKPV